VPLVIEIVERIDEAEPRIGRVAPRLSHGPRLPARPETTQLGEEGLSVTVMRGQPRMTHLVNEHPAFHRWRQVALNQDPVPQRFVEAVTPVQVLQVRSSPHRAPGDAAVKKLDVQIIKEPF